MKNTFLLLLGNTTQCSKILFKNSLAITAMIGSLIILVVLAINVIHSIDTLSLALSNIR